MQQGRAIFGGGGADIKWEREGSVKNGKRGGREGGREALTRPENEAPSSPLIPPFSPSLPTDKNWGGEEREREGGRAPPGYDGDTHGQDHSSFLGDCPKVRLLA